MIRVLLLICAALCFAAPASADNLRDRRCDTSARYEAMREGADCSVVATAEFRCNGTGAVPIGAVPTDAGSTLPTMEWTRLWMAAGVHCGDLVDPRHEAGYCYALGACGRPHVGAISARRRHVGDEWCSRHPDDCRWSSHVPAMPGRCVGRRPDCIFDGERWR